MHIKNQISLITQQIWNTCPPELFLEAYFQEDPANESEEAYRAGIQALAQSLDSGQAEQLAQAEALCRETLGFVRKCAVARGLCTAFQQFYEREAPPLSMMDLFRTNQFGASWMDGGWEYRDQRRLANDTFEHLIDELAGEAREHVISIEMAWDEREFGVLRHGLYLGYRLGLSILESVQPLGTIQGMRGQILLTEHELGLLMTDAEREWEQDAQTHQALAKTQEPQK
jgi:hypothetical protein